MPVPQVPVPMEPVVPIGITTTTVRAHLASRERIAAMTLMSAASLACASMVASALTPMGPSIASASQDTAGAHVRCPPSRVPHLSALTGAPVDKPATIPTSVLAYQVELLSVSIMKHTCIQTHANTVRVSVQTLLLSQALSTVLQAYKYSQPDDVAVSAVAGIYFSVPGQLPVCY